MDYNTILKAAVKNKFGLLYSEANPAQKVQIKAYLKKVKSALKKADLAINSN